MAAQLKCWVPCLQLIYPNIQRLTAWSADLEREFQAIQEAVKVSPIDINKTLFAFVDSAVTVGTAYVLAQRKDEKKGCKSYLLMLTAQPSREHKYNIPNSKLRP